MSDTYNFNPGVAPARCGEPRHISSSLAKEILSSPTLVDTIIAHRRATRSRQETPAPIAPAAPAAPATHSASVAEPRCGKITRMWTGDAWASFASLMTEQKRLCGDLWFEGEICILFADTNVGKSILAVQIADMIANGNGAPRALPELLPETLPQPVVYADFELSINQFGRRYSTTVTGADGRQTKAYYNFGPRFNRVELFYDVNLADSEEFASKEFADQIIADLESRISEAMAKVLIIDNITFMASGTETAADAMPLMKKLVALKKRHNLSILLLAHTPKRCLTNPLTRNDLQGSKMLINFADSAFAIGESSIDTSLRYIKQIKQRNCEQVYDRDNVLVCRIGHVCDNFLGFTSEGVSGEDKHLAERVAPGPKRKPELVAQVKSLKAEGLSAEEIASRLGIGRATVYRSLNETS